MPKKLTVVTANLIFSPIIKEELPAQQQQALEIKELYDRENADAILRELHTKGRLTFAPLFRLKETTSKKTRRLSTNITLVLNTFNDGTLPNDYDDNESDPCYFENIDALLSEIRAWDIKYYAYSASGTITITRLVDELDTSDPESTKTYNINNESTIEAILNDIQYSYDARHIISSKKIPN